jgi:predicted RNase H-like nuclease
MTKDSTTLAGIDLAWKTEGNSTAVVTGSLNGRVLQLEDVYEELRSAQEIFSVLKNTPALRGVAVDASLIINNLHGRRRCEADLTGVYRSRKAGCHPTNLTLYPDPGSVRLSRELAAAGFEHLGRPPGKWQIECYPHPAIIEIFGLPERLAYKKGPVAARRTGQVRLAELISSLATSPVLQLHIPDGPSRHVSPERIKGLRGAALKHNEDVLDAVVCLYVAGLYHLEVTGRTEAAGTVFGDTRDGYIYVPGAKGFSPTFH